MAKNGRPRVSAPAERGASSLTKTFFGELSELIDWLLCDLRRLCGLDGKGMCCGAVFRDNVWDDLSMAALTDDSIVASLGRNVEGIWSSS